MAERSSIDGVLTVIAVSLLLGFLMLSADKPIADSVKDSKEGALKLRELNILLHQDR